MKRALFLCLGLLSACTQNPKPPLSLADAVLKAGVSGSVVYTQPFGGSWSVAGLPDWLSAAPTSGSGNVNITFTVNRAAAAPAAADVPQLQAAPQLKWQASVQRGGASGVATLKISADLYQLSGQVSSGAVAINRVILPGAALRVSGSVQSRGIIVKYKTPMALSTAQAQFKPFSALNRPAALRPLSVSASVGRTLTLNASGDISAALSTLRADPTVDYAVPNALLRAQDESSVQTPYRPADEYAPLQYAYRLMGYGAVWRDMQNAPYPNAVTVAVLDTGVRFDHPDLAGRLWQSGEGALDVVTSDSDGPDTDPTDPGEKGVDGSHGTHVSGIIAAGVGSFAAPCAGCSSSGVVGAALTAPIKVLPVRVIDNTGNASESDVALAVRYAAGQSVTVQGAVYTNPHPAQVINLSLGGPISAANAQPLCDAVADATALGSLVVVAAGNGGGAQPYYPAACPGAVSVAAARPDAGGLPIHAEYSEYYPQVSLSAYGGADGFGNPTFNMGLTLGGKAVPDSIFSTSWDYTLNQPSYQFESGTSQAAPQVSALAALLLSKGVVTTGQQALTRMEATATDIGSTGRDDYTGYGVINAAAALGAPAVSNTLTLSVLGNNSSFSPALDAAGRFSAYLPGGSFQILAGYDLSGNGLGGEAGEPGARASVTLGPDKPAANLGTLQVQP